MLSEKVLEMLAFDLGLLIVSGWFFILLLMFREFQKVSHAINRLSDSTSTNNSLPGVTGTEITIEEITSITSEPLDKLAEINAELETKLQQESLDKKEIMLLNAEVDKSNKVIKDLKESLLQVKPIQGDDGTAAKIALGKAKEKIDRQDLQLKKLQIVADQVHIENDQLKQQVVNHLSKIKISVERSDLYSQKLIQQGKELTYLKAKTKAEGNDEEASKKMKQLQSQLIESKEELDRISTEKEFLETQFLDVLEEVEEKDSP